MGNKKLESSTNYCFYEIDDSVSYSDSVIKFIENIKNYSQIKKQHIFIIQSPLIDAGKYTYSYKDALILLSARNKLVFINLNSTDSSLFDEFCEEVIEDLGSISDKYKYKDKIGRPRTWNNIFERIEDLSSIIDNIDVFFSKIRIDDKREQRLSELLISLLTGSINDIDKIDGLNQPENILDKVKKKILLFDSTQTNFLFSRKNKKCLVIQGLSGTGKTELLLHKLKDIYTSGDQDKICFTCHNKILANNLRKRIPSFFNFMKVEQQIEWNERLWCTHAWGSYNDINSGAYRYICNFYNIPFLNFSNIPSFSEACRIALTQIQDDHLNNNKFAFDYMMIDESQDFDDNFLNLCERVTKNNVYIAGDIFQSIFGNQTISVSKDVDYLLNQCYRTDPRTLMFSHGLGMGLFEDLKLQWPSDDQWQDYGYIVEKTEVNEQMLYSLSRNPIRRFEDIQMESTSVDIKNIHSLSEKEIVNKIVERIYNIKDNNPTIKPGDIAIIFIEKNRNYNNRMSSLIRNELEKQGISWPINLAFETQMQNDDLLCITNHNHVKGLEFPFVICVAPNNLTGDLKVRNSLYMAMTRSFIQSTLFINISDSEVWEKYITGLESINTYGKIYTMEPSHDNKENIRQLNIEFDRNSAIPIRELIITEIKKIAPNLSPQNQAWIVDGILRVCGENYDRNIIGEKVKEMVKIIQ